MVSPIASKRGSGERPKTDNRNGVQNVLGAGPASAIRRATDPSHRPVVADSTCHEARRARPAAGFCPRAKVTSA
jgi:hypothetical protein